MQAPVSVAQAPKVTTNFVVPSKAEASPVKAQHKAKFSDDDDDDDDDDDGPNQMIESDHDAASDDFKIEIAGSESDDEPVKKPQSKQTKQSTTATTKGKEAKKEEKSKSSKSSPKKAEAPKPRDPLDFNPLDDDA